VTDGSTPAVPRTPTWRVRVNMVVGRVLFGMLYRVKVVGRSRVPRSGPVVFVANHVGFLDGPMLPALAPRPTSVLVKREMFRGPLGWFLAWIGHIPVTRNSGDRRALSAAVAVLQAGGAVGIFPEGTRGRGDVAAVQQGAAWLAQQGGARVVPVAFLGTRRTGASTGSLPRPWSRMVVEFGEPVDLTPDPMLTGRQRLAAASERVRETLATHVRESQERHRVFLPED
jgi:1-acyl-sn-glycerol-3-phosphate acyltransferase